MATYPAPSFFSDVFDTNAFIHTLSNGGLTQAEADLLYYHYPIGQSFQTLQQTDHTGLATFNAGIDINTGTLKFPDNTVQTTAATAGVNLLPLNNVWTGTNEFQSTVQFDSALIVSNGNQNTSLGNGFLPLASGQGTQNVFVGVGAGASALCGGANTVVGYFSASQGMTSTASYNTLYGTRAGQYLTSGVGNTCIGATNCNNNETGNSNICLGYGAMAGESSGALSNNIVIGNGIQSGASNRIILGDGTQTSMDLNVVSGSNVNMGGKLVMNDAVLASREISAVDYQLQGLGTGVNNGQIYINGVALNIINNVNSGTVPFYLKDGAGTSLTRFVIGSTEVDSVVPLYMTGTTDTSRLINSCYYQIADNASPFSTNKQMYSNGTNVVFDNDTQGGGYSFASEKSGGGQVVSLEITATGVSIPTGNGASATSSLSVSDSVSSNNLIIIPNASAGAYNPATDAGNQLILAKGTQNAETLELTTHSSTTTYVKVRPTSVGMGAGGTSTATTSVECNGTSVLITPSITFPDSTVQTTAFTGGVQNPTNWLVATGNLQNNAHLNNASKQCKMNIQTSIPFQILNALTARFKFEYSCYGCSAYTNSCLTAGTLNLCANNTVHDPNTITYFDMIYGYNGGSTTQAVFRMANIQTTSTYWNTTQTYIPKNATSSSYTFTPLSFTFTFSGTNPNYIQFNIGFPQNNSIGGSNPVGDMMCCSASLTLINSPPSGAYTGYSLDTITSTNTAGSWYFA